MSTLERYPIPDIIGLSPKKLGDERGFFSEVFRTDWFAATLPGLMFCQDNHAASLAKGTLRGLHFQYGPSAQAKLVRCVRGAILDVAVDIRAGSPTFGHYVAVELSATNWKQLLIPHGFAHGYCTLESNTEVLYKVDRFYDSDREGAILWRDRAIAIKWPFAMQRIITNSKDATALPLSKSPVYFSFQKGAGPFNVICHPSPQEV